jgi:hypothetical protein
MSASGPKRTQSEGHPGNPEQPLRRQERGHARTAHSAHSRESGNPGRDAKPELFALDLRFRGGERRYLQRVTPRHGRA